LKRKNTEKIHPWVEAKGGKSLKNRAYSNGVNFQGQQEDGRQDREGAGKKAGETSLNQEDIGSYFPAPS
jgi:hypothetical protein